MKKTSEKGRGKFTKAFAAAQEQVKKEQVEALAAEIRKVMLADRDAVKRIQAAQDERKILAQDLKDLKAGRIDKIKARQATDEMEKRYSKINVPLVEPLIIDMNKPMLYASGGLLHTSIVNGGNFAQAMTLANADASSVQ